MKIIEDLCYDNVLKINYNKTKKNHKKCEIQIFKNKRYSQKMKSRRTSIILDNSSTPWMK